MAPATTRKTAAQSGSTIPSRPPQQQKLQRHLHVLANPWLPYKENTQQRLKVIDAWLLFVLLTGIIQVVYLFLVGTYPYNAFLSSFAASVGSFVLAGIRLIFAHVFTSNFHPDLAHS
jgi:oligosaccharyltransferase complex subunit epsilon